MSDIPSDLFREILLRVPAEWLLRLRRVCKQWARIIDDSSFIKDHTQNHLYSQTLFLKNSIEGTIYSFSLDSLDFIDGPQLIDIRPVPVPRQLTGCFCNSLIARRVRQGFIIWNPLTNERRYVDLPQLITATPGYALGYDYDADDYKVVLINEYGKTHVYSLKSDSWRRIQDCPVRTHSVGGTFFNGTLYWPSQDNINILALHLGAEIFSEFPLPLVEFTISTNIDLYALDGCLVCSLDYKEGRTFYGWVMKDDKSWIKLFSLQYSIHMVKLRLVAFWKRKQQVVVMHRRGFLWFDIGTNSLKEFSIHGFKGIDYSLGSLVRLNVRDSAIGVGDVAAGIISRRKKKRGVTRYGALQTTAWLDPYNQH